MVVRRHNGPCQSCLTRASWGRGTICMSNGDRVTRLTELMLKQEPSADFRGWWHEGASAMQSREVTAGGNAPGRSKAARRSPRLRGRGDYDFPTMLTSLVSR